MNSTNRLLRFLSFGMILGLGSCSAQDPSAKSDAQKIDLFRQTGVIKPVEISESSGAAQSFYRPDAFWTINDSGNSATVYCLNIKGDLPAKVALEGGQNRDWESMSRFTLADKHYLVVADVGDNLARYEHCRLYIFQEPKFEIADQAATLKVAPITIEFIYPDGARDCESVAIDPTTNDIWLFEKSMQFNLKRNPHVYRIAAKDWLPRLTPEDQPASQKNGGPSDAESKNRLTAQRLGAINHRFITDGAFSPDGSQLILRTYTHLIHFQKNETDSWVQQFPRLKPTLLPLPIQNQGEAIAFFPDSTSALITSEGVRQPIWLIDLAASLKEAKQ